MTPLTDNLNDLSASQAAKLFHLSPSEFETLRQVRGLLQESMDSILSRLCSKLSMLPGGGSLLGTGRRTARTRRSVRRWLDIALRPWNPDIREPGLRRLAVFCAKQGIAVAYVAAMFACLIDACMEALSAAERSGKLSHKELVAQAKVVRKRLTTEELGLVAIYSRASRQRIEGYVHQIERDLKIRAIRLGSTVSLSQAVAAEIDETQILRVLAKHVMDTFAPDHLSIHLILPGDVVETPVTIVDGRQVSLPDDEAMSLLRQNWRLCRVARTGRLMHVGDVHGALLGCNNQEWAETSGCHCCVPLADGTTVFGWMHLRRHEPNSLSAEDIEVLGIYGQTVGTALRSLRLVEENHRQATNDALTEVGNRRYFETVLEKEELLARRRGSSVCMLVIDVDRFKTINDTYGHATGDRALQGVANILREQIRRSDEVARIGGDEFILLLRDCDVAAGQQTAQRIVDALGSRTFCMHDGKPVSVSVTIGVAGYPNHGDTLEATIALADAALLQAKQLGRNRCQVFEGESEASHLPVWRSPAESQPTPLPEATC